MAATPDIGRGDSSTARRRDSRLTIIRVAMDLFERDGYDATTIDAIAEGAGVARRTFFHHFTSKDELLFTDHSALIDRVSGYLADHTEEAPVDAVGGALRIILTSYLADPQVSLRRYRLIRQTPELREREIAWVHRYQLTFSRYLDQRFAGDPYGPLAAEAVAASLVAVHNHVLRQWLKAGGTGDALQDLGQAQDWVGHSVALIQRGDGRRRVIVAVFDDDIDPKELIRRVQTPS